MTNIYKRYRFPPSVIQHAVWLYFRFNLSTRDVEDLLAERNIFVSYEAIRLWINKFGPLFTKRPPQHSTVRQQSIRALTPANQSAGTRDEEVQIDDTRPAISGKSC
jgi:transposase-like protein